LPHAPQLPESEPVSTQRSPHRVSVPASAPASPAAPVHVKLHWLFAQVGVPPGGAVHAAAQPPQFSGSVERLTHLLSQLVCPCLHATTPPSGLGFETVRRQVFFALHVKPLRQLR